MELTPAELQALQKLARQELSKSLESRGDYGKREVWFELWRKLTDELREE